MNRTKNLAHGLIGPNAGLRYVNRQIKRQLREQTKVTGREAKVTLPLRPTAMVNRYLRQRGIEYPSDGTVPKGDPMTPAQRRRFMKKVRKLDGA